MDGFEFLLRPSNGPKSTLSKSLSNSSPTIQFHVLSCLRSPLIISILSLTQAFLDHSFTPKILYTASKLKKKGGSSFKIKVIIAGPSVLMKFDMENQMSLGMMMLFKFF